MKQKRGSCYFLFSAIIVFSLLCFFLAYSPCSPSTNIAKISKVLKKSENRSSCEKDEDSYLDYSTQSFVERCHGQEKRHNKVALSRLCNNPRDVSGDLIDSLNNPYFYSKFETYQTLKSQKIIDFSRYSRFEVVDWLFDIGTISLNEKLDFYTSFFSNAFFENESCLTCLYDYCQKEISGSDFKNGGKTLLSQERRNISVYSTLHFDVNYDSNEFLTDNIPSQIGQRFESIRTFFIDKGYRIPNNQSGFNRYQINIFHNPGANYEAGLTVFDGVPCPNTTTFINMYYVSYTELDSMFDEVAAHEWFHAIKTQYFSGLAWFDESFANWAGIIYDGDSEHQNGTIIDFLNANVSLDDDSYKYGACLFPLTLYKCYGKHTFIKSLFTTFDTVIQNHPNYTPTQKLIEAVNQTLSLNGYSHTFDDALRRMHGYNYLPNSWYNDACSTSTTCYWYNDDVTTYNLLPLTGYSESDVEGYKTYTNIHINKLGRQYFRLLPTNGNVYNVDVEISFNGGNGLAQHHEIGSSGSISFNLFNNVANTTSWHFYSLGSRYIDAGIILSNTSSTSDCTCSITIRYKTIREAFTFKLSDRLFQRRFFLDKNEYAEYTIKFVDQGRKIIQTLGEVDTKIELLSLDGTPLNNPVQDDDKGYSYNAFSTYDCSANETIKIRISFYNANESGFIKLIVTNSGGITINLNGIQQLSDIVEIVHNNFIYGTWGIQYKTKLLLYRPSSSGNVRITLDSVFDNYLYVIDPSSNLINQNGIDYDDDSGSGTNASITRYMSALHPYLIIFSQYNPSSAFSNLDEGDDLTIRFERISS